jgi:glycerophosphoryl diester phosphodiesterase
VRGIRHPYVDRDGPLAFAHRGGAKEAPENSRAAFRYAVGLGYSYLETDLRATSDGIVVLNHDPTLDRTTTSSGMVAQMPWETVRDVQVGGEPILTLDEFMDEFPDQMLNIDCKDDHTLEPLIRTLRRRGEQVFERICVGAFSQRRLDHIRIVFGPRLATSTGPAEIGGIMARSRGLPVRLPRAPHVVAAQVPLRWRQMNILTPAFVEVAHSLGMDVHAWTIDDPDTMRALFATGVDGIVSDRPSVLLSVMAERSPSSP